VASGRSLATVVKRKNDRQGPQERLGHAGGREATHTGEPPSNETTRIRSFGTG
jgi:hypothetical protein